MYWAPALIPYLLGRGGNERRGSANRTGWKTRGSPPGPLGGLFFPGTQDDLEVFLEPHQCYVYVVIPDIETL